MLHRHESGVVSTCNSLELKVSEHMAYRSVEIARLHAQREALDKELAEARERESGRALREIVQKMREYGISLNELMGRKPSVEAAAESTAESTGSTVKYRDPVSGSTWSGR